MEEARQQTVIIEGQKKIVLTGVESVDGFTAQQISLTLISGRAHITGDELKIAGFSKQDGSFTATGKITGVRFGAKRGKLWKKILGRQ